MSMWQQYCKDCYSGKPVKGGIEMEKEKQKKEAKAPKYGKDVEDKIVALFKAGKNPTEISKEFDGHPGVPKVKRVLKAHNL